MTCALSVVARRPHNRRPAKGLLRSVTILFFSSATVGSSVDGGPARVGIVGRRDMTGRARVGVVIGLAFYVGARSRLGIGAGLVGAGVGIIGCGVGCRCRGSGVGSCARG